MLGRDAVPIRGRDRRPAVQGTRRHIEASDEDGITWIDLSRLSRPDREALVAILNRTTICEGHGELSDEDAAFLAAERDDGSEAAHREWIRANDRTD